VQLLHQLARDQPHNPTRDRFVADHDQRGPCALFDGERPCQIEGFVGHALAACVEVGEDGGQLRGAGIVRRGEQLERQRRVAQAAGGVQTRREPKGDRLRIHPSRIDRGSPQQRLHTRTPAAGQRGEAGHSDYAATKGAIISMTKGLSTELAPFGIYVNCVAPGWVDTDMSRPALDDPSSGEERVFFGECRGRLAAERRGSRGFGYDPVFVPDEDGQGRTMSELSDEEKDRISHRGRAVRAFVRWLRER